MVELKNPTMGDRYNKGKPQLSYVMEFPNAVKGVSLVAEFGAIKYARNNYKSGLKHVEIIDSLLRHMSDYMAGEDVDPESGLPHVFHIAWNGLALAEMTKLHPELDWRKE